MSLPQILQSWKYLVSFCCWIPTSVMQLELSSNSISVSSFMDMISSPTPLIRVLWAFSFLQTTQFSWGNLLAMQSTQYQLLWGITLTAGSTQEIWYTSSQESHTKQSLPSAFSPQCLQLQTLNTPQATSCSSLVCESDSLVQTCLFCRDKIQTTLL